MDELPAKLAADLLLAAVSYQVQMRWVFRVDRPAPCSAPEQRTVGP